VGVVGRSVALAAADRLFDRAADGPAALVYEGEAGIGKTTVWEQALAEASGRGFRILRTRPGQADTAVPFAGLVDLFEDVAAHVVDLLPQPQQIALRAAVLDADERANRLALGTAVRNVLRQVALAAPVVVAVDDLQWLDDESARTLEFALRRLDRDPVAILATVRSGVSLAADPTRSLLHANVARCAVGRLTPPELEQLVAGRLGLRLSRVALEILHGASGGNPFFALELGRSVRAGTIELTPGRPLTLAASLHELLATRVGGLPVELKDALLTVAALGDPRPADLDAELLAAAEDRDLLVIDGERVRFSHPLLRSAVYDSATPAIRRRRHLELATRVGDIVESAFHLALGSTVKDEPTASRLETGALHAARRGARESSAKLYEHAARLTPRREDWLRRQLAAVEQLMWVGSRDRADPILRAVEVEVPRGPLRALAAYWRRSWIEDPYELDRHLAEACEEADDPTLVLLLLERAEVLFRERSFSGGREVAYRALQLAESVGRGELVVSAMGVVLFYDMGCGLRVDHERVGRVLRMEDELNAEGIDPEGSVRMAYGQLLTYAGELEAARRLLEQHARRSADLGHVNWAQAQLAFAEWRAGELAAALRNTREFGRAAGSPTEAAFASFIEAFVLATQGALDDALARIEQAEPYFRRAGERINVVGCHNVRGFVAYSQDRFGDAVREFTSGIELMRELGWRECGVHAIYQNCAQALVALGRVAEAEPLLDELEEMARPLNRVPALAGALRARATIAAAAGAYDRAVSLCERSLELQGRLPEPFDLAHTRLVLGTVLRRAQKKARAREALQAAVDEFDAIGARVWRDKANAELRRIGGRAPARNLTATEEKIAALVATGRTNQEVATALFMSPKTVEWNLSKIYRKLDVSSRVELAAKLARRPATPASLPDSFEVSGAGVHHVRSARSAS
jgi:DNA-binding CsgD family transcriptional regulator